MYDFKAKRVEHLRRGLAVVPNEVPQRGMYRKVGNEKGTEFGIWHFRKTVSVEGNWDQFLARISRWSWIRESGSEVLVKFAVKEKTNGAGRLRGK